MLLNPAVQNAPDVRPPLLDDKRDATAHPLHSIRWDVKITDQAERDRGADLPQRGDKAIGDLVYNFPILPSTSVCSLKARIDDKPEIIAKVLPKQDAKIVYEAVIRGQSAMLMRLDDIIALNIGQLQPGATCVVSVGMGFVCEKKMLMVSYASPCPFPSATATLSPRALATPRIHLTSNRIWNTIIINNTEYRD